MPYVLYYDSNGQSEEEENKVKMITTGTTYFIMEKYKHNNIPTGLIILRIVCTPDSLKKQFCTRMYVCIGHIYYVYTYMSTYVLINNTKIVLWVEKPKLEHAVSTSVGRNGKR